MKFSIKTEWLPLLVVLCSLAMGAYFAASFPATVVTHWNFMGQPDAWGNGRTHALIFPAMLLAIYAMFFFLPRLDPNKERYEEFSSVYMAFRTAILLALALIQLIAGLFNLGHDIAVGTWVPIIIGGLFIFLGNFMAKLKRNWFVGVRTPWTISSENVWNKTNRMGGFLFALFGLGLMLTPFLNPALSAAVLFGGVGVVVIGTFVYSYWLYRKEQSGSK